VIRINTKVERFFRQRDIAPIKNNLYKEFVDNFLSYQQNFPTRLCLLPVVLVLCLFAFRGRKKTHNYISGKNSVQKFPRRHREPRRHENLIGCSSHIHISHLSKNVIKIRRLFGLCGETHTHTNKGKHTT